VIGLHIPAFLIESGDASPEKVASLVPRYNVPVEPSSFVKICLISWRAKGVSFFEEANGLKRERLDARHPGLLSIWVAMAVSYSFSRIAIYSKILLTKIPPAFELP
jgi:hypothetical protein